MELRVERLWPRDNYTIGRLYVNGEFFSNTLEDKVIDVNKNGVFDGNEKKFMEKVQFLMEHIRLFLTNRRSLVENYQDC